MMKTIKFYTLEEKRNTVLIIVLLIILVFSVAFQINFYQRKQALSKSVMAPGPSSLAAAQPTASSTQTIISTESIEQETPGKTAVPTITAIPIKTTESIRTLTPTATEKIVTNTPTKTPVNPVIPGETKVAYLTFDDGPTRNITPKILDILKENNIHATFFVIGSMAKASPDILKRIHNEGHLIGYHSYSHVYSKVYKNNTSFLKEFSDTEKVIANIIPGYQTDIIRFPGGSKTYGHSQYRKVAQDAGYKIYDWNALLGDAQEGIETKSQMKDYLMRTLKGKNEAIILMHDFSTAQSTVELLPWVIDYLRQNGYRFELLPE